jgi:hypothetical protein
VYGLSALTGEGTQPLVYDLMARLEALRAAGRAPAKPADAPWDPVSD